MTARAAQGDRQRVIEYFKGYFANAMGFTSSWSSSASWAETDLDRFERRGGQGKYFNKIADDLRRHHKGTTFAQMLNWATTLHGYLSSPTGGGIRHGAGLKAGIALQPNEARLFCNLIRSYITFLMEEHERLSQ